MSKARIGKGQASQARAVFRHLMTGPLYKMAMKLPCEKLPAKKTPIEPKRKMTDDQIRECRFLHETHKWTYDSLAEKYAMNKHLIRSVCQYITAANVK